MHYIVYIIIGIGIGLSFTSILKGNSKKVQNAKDDLEAKKEWVRMVSNQTKVGDKNGRRR
jgi:hypothetical protein